MGSGDENVKIANTLVVETVISTNDSYFQDFTLTRMITLDRPLRYIPSSFQELC